MAQLGELKTWGHNICYGNFILNYIGMICQKSGCIPSLKTYAQGFDSLRRKKDFGVKKLHVSEIVNSKGGGGGEEATCHAYHTRIITVDICALFTYKLILVTELV